MKQIVHISIIFVVILLLGKNNSFAQNEINPNGYNVFYFENGLISSEGTMRNGKPDGYWKTYYDNKVLKSEGNRNNFELDSVWIFYNTNGSIAMEINYKNGKKDGVKKRYNNDTILISEENFYNDLKNGVSIFNYPDGKTQEKINYENNYKQGKTYEYSEDGHIITIITYENDFIVNQEQINRKDLRGLKTGTWKLFYDNGFVKLEGKYMNDKLEGFFREFSSDGKLLNTYKYTDGELVENALEQTDIKVEKEYYPGAKIKSEMTLVNGIPNGVYRKYSIAGDITDAAIYRNGNIIGKGIVDKQGKMQNKWTEFYLLPFKKGGDTELKKAEGNYENGTKKDEWVYYHENGNIEQKGFYINGRPHGIWKWYYESGNLLREEEFENGKENGFLLEYSDSGKIITKGSYTDGVKEGMWEYGMGNYREQGNYKDGKKDGVWKHYYLNNGVINFEGEFIDGNPNGKHKYYYENGKVKEEGNFIMGAKDGQWENYDKEGNIILISTYESGRELKIDGVKIKPETDPSDQ